MKDFYLRSGISGALLYFLGVFLQVLVGVRVAFALRDQLYRHFAFVGYFIGEQPPDAPAGQGEVSFHERQCFYLFLYVQKRLFGFLHGAAAGHLHFYGYLPVVRLGQELAAHLPEREQARDKEQGRRPHYLFLLSQRPYKRCAVFRPQLFY